MQDLDTGFGEFSVGTTLVRVVTDCSVDISAIVRGEERVIRGLMDKGLWRHTAVTLFVLENMTPLVSQLRQLRRVPDDATIQLPQRPMVNLYDPRHPQECFVFVNRQMMASEGYWSDALAAEGLLAHEHAHPLSEAAATAAARSLKVVATGPASFTPLAEQLADTLSRGAVTEILANEFCIANGFAEALKHVDRITLLRARDNLAQRSELRRRLAAAVVAGSLSRDDEAVLLTLADAQMGLPFALELVPFFRTSAAALGTELEGFLVHEILSRMKPAVEVLYHQLHTRYLELRSEWSADRLIPWCEDILSRIAALLAIEGTPVTLRIAAAGAPPQPASPS